MAHITEGAEAQRGSQVWVRGHPSDLEGQALVPDGQGWCQVPPMHHLQDLGPAFVLSVPQCAHLQNGVNLCFASPRAAGRIQGNSTGTLLRVWASWHEDDTQ